MAENIHNMLVSLRSQRDKLNDAIAALEKLEGKKPTTTPTSTGGRGISEAAKKKIAASQKARWAKIKAQKKAGAKK